MNRKQVNSMGDMHIWLMKAMLVTHHASHVYYTSLCNMSTHSIINMPSFL